MVVVCDTFELNGDSIGLTNFSIVNGGQTTTQVAHMEKDAQDFFIACKIVKIAGALGVWVTNLIDLSASPIAEIWGIDSSETSALQRTIINDLSELNEEGQMEAALCIHKLTENPKYKCVKPNMPKESTAETN